VSLIAEREELDDEKPDEIVDTTLAKTGPTTDQMGGVTGEPMVMPTQPIEATTVSHKSGHEVASGQTIYILLPGPTVLASGQAVQVSLPGFTTLASGQAVQLLFSEPTALGSGQAINVPLPGPTTLTRDSGYEPTSE
jgi:hypothetical protein